MMPETEFFAQVEKFPVAQKGSAKAEPFFFYFHGLLPDFSVIFRGPGNRRIPLLFG
jgi:hypothetical protein